MRFLVAFLIFFIVSILAASDITYEEAKKLSIKELRAKISERGLQCKGCSEKDDYIKLFVDNQNLPIIEKPSTKKTSPPNDASSADDKDSKKKEMDDVSIYLLLAVNINNQLIYPIFIDP